MREILFRGKRADNGEWATSPYPYGTMSSDTMTHDFVLDTVGQYTGMTDKNGVKIFEGDIFLNKFHNEPTNIGIVRYGEYCNAFNSDPYCSHIGFYVDWNDDLQIMRKDLGFWCKRREVVGNIFDNPELVEMGVNNVNDG